MTKYQEFLSTKVKSFISSGFNVDELSLNSNLFDFQKHIVKIALKKGRFAIFEDCGLGKTIQQLSWAEQVNRHTKKPVLILAPLAVVQQTIKEGAKFGIELNHYGNNDNIQITNYDQLKNISDIDSCGS